MPPDLADLADQINLSPDQWIGIPIALVGAVFLSLGAQFQHRGVVKVETSHGNGVKAGLSIRQLMALTARPSWVIGTLLLGLAIVFQLTSLYFAPLIVVQPLGAVALVITAIMNTRISKVKLDRLTIRAIILCVGGVALFVTIASITAKTHPITEVQLITVLIIFGAVLAAFAVLFALLRDKFKAMFYIVGAGVLFGFVATLAKVVIGRIRTLALADFQTGQIEWLTITCVVALLAGALLGSYFVQTAYASGPPDLVVAGLTVIDPLVAVSIGIIVLGEAATAELWAIGAFIVSGVIAVYGVILLSRHHPQTKLDVGL